MRHRLGIVILAAAAAAGGCVHQDDRPDLTGPSALAQSVTVTSNPDVLFLGQNGPGQSSTIVVRLFDESGQAETQRTDVRLDIIVGSTIQDCGTLTQKNIQTGSDGIATATFTAPRGNPLPVECTGFSAGQSIRIRAVPIGTNFQTAQGWTVEILMVSQGVILPPADTPTPAFVFAPASPVVGADVAFDGSASCAGPASGSGCAATTATITSYSWNFGDGATDSGRVVSHDFAAAGTYNVTLTVTNDRGRSASVTHFVSVGAPPAPAPPVALFTPTAQSLPLAGGTACFDAFSSRTPSGAPIVDYRWNFGDNLPSSIINGPGTTAPTPPNSGTFQTPCHLYGPHVAVPGSLSRTWTVTLIVTDANGLQSTPATGTVTIGP